MTTATGNEPSLDLLPARQVQRRLTSLRRNTAAHHAAVERRVDIVGRLATTGRYVDLLSRLYGFYEPFEAELDAAVARWRLPYDVVARRKAPLIARDLEVLGITRTALDELPRCSRAPRPAGPDAALGCLYVTEGATLGGRLIARHVEHRLGLGPGDGASFFHAYGPDVGPRWRTFCSVLAAASRSEVARGAILAGAVETFVAYDGWLADGAGC
jgi:heme oxygenase